MYFLGIDVGSLSCDAVLIDDQAEPVSWAVVPTGARNCEAIAKVQAEALAGAGISSSQLSGLVATGYGRDRVEGRIASVTEITCHARGMSALLPGTDVVVDIGGQDSKAIRLDQDGRVQEFAMNDKCAAGTGRFLEAMARALEIRVEELGTLSAESSKGITLSSMCTVFAESEVVSLIAEGTEVAEIVAGLHRAIASRTQALIKRVAPAVSGLKISMSGGVARNSGVVKALSELVGTGIAVAPEPDTVGALGAALIARDRSS
jgi:predicted CoA-substrate-specific enzyme activase